MGRTDFNRDFVDAIVDVDDMTDLVSYDDIFEVDG